MKATGAIAVWLMMSALAGVALAATTVSATNHQAYAANVGWISLSNSQACVRTDRLGAGPDTDGDGLPDAWELAHTGSRTNLQGGSADRDSDGRMDTEEYLADTDPLDSGSLLKVIALARASGTNRVTWAVEPTRLYRLEQSGSATNGAAWSDSGLGLLAPGAGLVLTGAVADASATQRFLRAQAVLPLAP